jgi:hypothetical protein
MRTLLFLQVGAVLVIATACGYVTEDCESMAAGTERPAFAAGRMFSWPGHPCSEIPVGQQWGSAVSRRP